MEEYKTCNKCKQVLAVESFGVKTGPKANKDGRRSRCKPCSIQDYKDYKSKNLDKVRNSKRNWSLKNKEKVAEMNRTYQQKNLIKLSHYNKNYRQENLQKLKSQQKEWRANNKSYKAIMDKKWAQENPKKIRLASKRYRENNPGKAAAAALRYAKKNPEVKLQISHKRRAALQGSAIYRVTAKDVRKIMLKPCVYCGQVSQHLDHVIPIARGGQHRIGNLVASCARCNQSKNKLFISEWKRRRQKDGY